LNCIRIHSSEVKYSEYTLKIFKFKTFIHLFVYYVNI